LETPKGVKKIWALHAALLKIERLEPVYETSTIKAFGFANYNIASPAKFWPPLHRD
jgi:hypothetical protein